MIPPKLTEVVPDPLKYITDKGTCTSNTSITVEELFCLKLSKMEIFYTRIKVSQDWEASLGLVNPNSYLEQDQLEYIAQDLTQFCSEHLHNGDSTISLGKLFLCLTTLTIKGGLFYAQLEFPAFQFVLIASHPVTGHY